MSGREITITNIKDAMSYVDSLFGDYGDIVSFDKEDGMLEDRLAPIIVEAIEQGVIEDVYNFNGEYSFSVEDIASFLFEMFDSEIIAWESERVFDSPGYDLYILSYIVRRNEDNHTFYSLNNTHDF